MCDDLSVLQNLGEGRKCRSFQLAVSVGKTVSHTACVEFDLTNVISGNLVAYAIEKLDNSGSEISVVRIRLLELFAGKSCYGLQRRNLAKVISDGI